MNLFYKILLNLQTEMEKPIMYGWFHILCLVIAICLIIYFIKNKNTHNEKTLKKVLFVYGVVAFILELLKQIVWSFNYDKISGVVTWDYQWYAAPFQLCTTPIYVSLICLFLKKGKVRDSLLSYMAYVTILGSIATAFYPVSVFTKTILINIHTMYLHLGSLVVSIYLLASEEVKIKFKEFINGYIVFLIFALIAEILNVIIYNMGILNGETFNMFYISPYFISELPVYNTIQENSPFILFILIYLVTMFIGSYIVFIISKLIEKIKNRIIILKG